MNGAVRCGRTTLLVASFLLFAPLMSGAGALPDLHPPATSADVGDLGTYHGFTYATAEGGILVAPGSEVTLVVDYLFEDAGGPWHATALHYVAVLTVTSDSGTLGSVATTHTATVPGTAESGTLEFVLNVPEVAAGWTVTLKATFHLSDNGRTKQIGEATSSAPLTVAAVPEPVPFATEDLVVGDVLDAGSITYTGSLSQADPTDGHTFVSTDLGTRFTATATAERPALQNGSDMYIFSTASLGVQIKDGPSYFVSRTLFSEWCSDWNDHSCSWSGWTRSVDLELVVPPSALGPRSIVTTHLHLNHEMNYYSAPTGDQEWDHTMFGGSGRHVVVGA